MQVTFDLISDLHIETWPGDFDWTGMGTSQFCIVTGDRGRRWCFVRIPDQQTAELPPSGSQQ